MSAAEYKRRLVDLARAVFAMDGIEVGDFYEVPSAQFERVNEMLLCLPEATLRGLRREIAEGQSAFELLLDDPEATDPFDGPTDLRTKLAAETKRADDAEAQRDKLADLLREESARLRQAGCLCITTIDRRDEAEKIIAYTCRRIDAALAEMEGEVDGLNRNHPAT